MITIFFPVLVVSSHFFYTEAADCERLPTVSFLEQFLTQKLSSNPIYQNNFYVDLSFDSPVFICMVAGRTIKTYQQLTVALNFLVYHEEAQYGSGYYYYDYHSLIISLNCQMNHTVSDTYWFIRPTILFANHTIDNTTDNGYCSSCSISDVYKECLACDPSCNTGLMRCTGQLSTDCCLAYDMNGACVSKIASNCADQDLFNYTCSMTSSSSTGLSLPVTLGSIIAICIVAILLLMLEICPSFLFRQSNQKKGNSISV